MKRFLIPVICITLSTIFFYSCSEPQEPYDSIEADEISLTKQTELDGGDELVIGNINQAEIIENGNILLLDTQQKKIHLFDSLGNFVRSELSEGEGPGEIRQAGRMNYSNGLVQIYDWSQRKLSQYRLESDTQNGNLQLTFSRDIRPEIYPSEFHISPEETNYVLFYPEPIVDEGQIRIQSMSQDGELVGDPVLMLPDDETIEVRNEQGQLMVTFSSPHSRQILPVFHGNRLFLGRSEQVGFEVYDLSTGEQVDSVAYTRPDVELTSVEKREFMDGMLERMGMEGIDSSSLISQMPDLKGKTRSMFYDPDGIIWLNLISEESSQTPEWILLDEDGSLLGQVTEEFDGPVMAVHHGKLYIREETEEGAQFLGVYEYGL